MQTKIISAETIQMIRMNSRKDSSSFFLRVMERRIREAAEMGQDRLIVFEIVPKEVTTALTNAGYKTITDCVCDQVSRTYLYFTTIYF